MDPETWQEQSAAFARAASQSLDLLQASIPDAAARGSFRALWDQTRAIGDSIRSAPAVATEDKIALQRRLNALVRALREEQRRYHQAVEKTRDEISAALDLAREAAAESQSVADSQEVRADLALIRERITGLDPSFPRALRTELWEAWQQVNRTAWDALVRQWEGNERELAAILDEARAMLDRGQARPARDAVKSFHAALAERECSRRAAKDLRQRAATLWEEAIARGREQHEHFVAAAQRRVQRWRSVLARNERQRDQMVGEIAALQRQMESATTDVGHALVRGRLTEAQRSLHQLETVNERLRRQIAEAEAAAGQPVTPVS
jgi:chromosome segregation ATPase